MDQIKNNNVPFDAAQPLAEFGALLKFLRENNMAKEELIVRGKAPELARIYDKLIAELPAGALAYLNKRIDKAYEQFLDDMDKKFGFWH